MSRSRPVSLRASVLALGFVGVTALAGGVEMLLFPQGNVFVEGAWLEHLPVTDYRLPGLVLGGVIGLGSLVTAFGLVRRPEWRWTAPVERRTGRHWSWAATGACGIVLMVWLVVEVALIPERSAVEGLYAALATVVLVSWLTPAFSRSLRHAAPR